MVTICEKEGRGDGGVVQRGGKGLVTVGGEEASGGGEETNHDSE